MQNDQTTLEWLLDQARDACGLAALVCLILALTYLGLHFTPDVKPV